MSTTQPRLAPALAALLLLAACQAPGLPKSADATYQDARAAVGSAISYRLAVSLDLNGLHQTYNLAVLKSGGTSGTLNIDGTPVDIVQSTGSTFIRGRAFIEKYGNPAVAAQVGDRWVRTSSNPLGAAGSLGPDALGQAIVGKASLQGGGDQTVDGVVVTKVFDRNGALYIARNGKPYLVRVETAAGVRLNGLSNLVADYSDYNSAKPDPPPASFVDTTR